MPEKGHGGGGGDKAPKGPKAPDLKHAAVPKSTKPGTVDMGGIDPIEFGAQATAAVGATVFAGHKLTDAFVGTSLTWDALAYIGDKLFGAGGGGGGGHH